MNNDVLLANPQISITELRSLHTGTYQWIYGMVADQQVAEDVLQEVYTMIIAGEARFDGASNLKTWLYAVARNVAIKSLQRSRREVPPTGREVAGQADNETEGIDEQREKAAQVSAAIRSLPQRQREIIELVMYRDFTLQQCGQILGVSVGSVRTHYHRAKASLGKMLAGLL